jgi:diguanylate cyclase (GGDEF)-like protein
MQPHPVNARVDRMMSSLIDPLTGVRNLRAIANEIEWELDGCRRSRGEYALLLVDIDRLGTINQRLGHAVGDLLLRRLARCLETDADRGSVCARCDGDEFVVTLPHRAEEEVVRRAALLREEAEQVSIPVAGDGRLTAAISVAVAVASRDGYSLAALLATARERMKSEKRSRCRERHATTAHAHR